MVLAVVPPVWGTLKKPLVECVVKIDDAVATRFPRTCERLSGMVTTTDGIQVSSSPLGLGRALGQGLLERTEAVLDAWLPHVDDLLTESATTGPEEDERHIAVKDGAASIAGSRVPRPLPFFQMFAVQLSSGSHTLRVTVLCVQDTYSSLVQRLGFDRVWQLLKGLQRAEVQRQLVDAARDPPAAAVRAITYLGCERIVGEGLDWLLSSRLAVRLLGARCTAWASWTADATGSSCRATSPSGSACFPASAAGVQSGSVEGDSVTGPQGRPQLSQVEQDAALAMGLRIVVKNSFIELVPEDEASPPTCTRRSRSCDAILATRPALLQPQAPPVRTASPDAEQHQEARARADAGRMASGSSAERQSAPQVAATSAAAAAAVAAQDDETDGEVAAGGGRTTLMLRNLPLDLSRDVLLGHLDDAGFAGAYNFVYLPVDFTRRRGLGYALVSACTPEVAEVMLLRLDGHRLSGEGGGDDAWKASWSEPCRSVTEHVQRYRNSPVMHPNMPDEYKPAIFLDGKRVAFPPPTRPIRPPRIRHLKASESHA